MKQPPFRLFLIVIAVLLGGAPLVWGLGSVLYEDPSTMRSIPKKTEAGYLKSGDGGVVSLMNTPAPTAVGQVLGISGLGTQPSATWQTVPSTPLGTSARISATTVTSTASATSTTAQASGAMCILPKATTSVWGVSEFDTTLPLADGVPSVGSGGKELQSNHVHPPDGAERLVYYPVGPGGVAPTSLAMVPNSTADTYTATVTSSDAAFMYVYAPTGNPGVDWWPPGTWKIVMWLSATNTVTVNADTQDFYGGNITVPGGGSLTEYDVYFTSTSGYAHAGARMLLGLYGSTATTSVITVGIGAGHSTSMSAPMPKPDRLANISGTTGNISQVPCWGSYTNITTNTGTSTDVSLCTIPIASTTAPSLVQISTATPLMDAASGSAGNGLQCSAWNHVHPISNSGLIYYATSGAGFSTTMPGTPTELTQAMSAGSATITLATTSGTPGLSVWPAGTLNFDLWAYMASPGSGCTYTLEATSPPTVVAAVRGTSTPYQTGSSTAGVTLTGSYAEYKFTIPVSQLTGTSTDIFKTPLVVTSANTTTCNAATLHIGVGTGQATNIGTLFYQVPSLDGVEYQVNKNTANGYCPLDSSTLVPVANLPLVTESVAGAMSAADKIILDNMVSDTYEVKVAAGTTPGYLRNVVESPDSSITWDTAGNYLTAAVNFGTGTSQVCSGSTCAGLQPTLPACVSGQIHQAGTITQTGTDTTTTTVLTCQNPPAYTNTPLDTNDRIAAASGTASATSTKAMPSDAKVARSTSADIATKTTTATTSSTATDLMPSDAKVRIPVASASQQGIGQGSSSRNISTNTATITSSSTAGAVFMPADAQVTLPKASTTGAGIAQQGTNAAIGSSSSTGTRSSTDTTGTFMPIDATANGDHKMLAQANAPNVGYLEDEVCSPDGSITLGDCADCCTGTHDTPYHKASIQARAGTTSVAGVLQLDPNAPPAVGTGAAGSNGLAAGGNHTHALPSSVFQCTGSAGVYVKTSGSNTCSAAKVSDDGTEANANGNFKIGTSPPNFQGPSSYGGLNLSTRGMLFFSNSDTNNPVALVSNAYLDGSSVWRYENTGPAASVTAGTGQITIAIAASGTKDAALTWSAPATISSAGIAATNITATPAASKIPIADASGTLNAWVTHSVRSIFSVIISATESSYTDGTWTTFLSEGTSGYAGSVVVSGSLGLSINNPTSFCKARIALDGTAIGGELITSSTVGWMSLSPIGQASFSAGSHTVTLQVASTNGSSCTALVDGDTHRASMQITEYTN